MNYVALNMRYMYYVALMFCGHLIVYLLHHIRSYLYFTTFILDRKCATCKHCIIFLTCVSVWKQSPVHHTFSWNQLHCYMPFEVWYARISYPCQTCPYRQFPSCCLCCQIARGSSCITAASFVKDDKQRDERNCVHIVWQQAWLYSTIKYVA